MAENITRSKAIKNSKPTINNINVTNKNKAHTTNSREKILMAEKRSVAARKLKNNIIKIILLLLVLLIVFIYVNSNKKPDISETSNIAKLNSNKYSSEIVNLYNRDGQLDLFVVEMNRVQTLVGTYLISNSTLKENSFSELVATLNSEINNDNWTKLNSQKSIYYNGTYSIDDSGNLKFKFGSKKIEPSWIKSENISRYIILN